MTQPRKKLIEVALPLPEINDASAYDKMPGIGPHPKGIHHWWARLPLPTARAVLFASVVTDPSDDPAWKDRSEQEQDAERERLFGIIRRMMQKKLHEHPEVYAEAYAEMLKHCDGILPPVLDPFAGGGSIPLEAARLGCEAHAADLNPVAVLLNKCNLEIAPRWTNHPPINPEDRKKILATRAPRPHRQWHSRGYIPHFDHPGLVQSITFRLADSVPAEVVAKWRVELNLAGGESADDSRCAELRERIEKYADEGKGACWLRQPEIAGVVENALLHFDGERYRLLAWCVMPNHVHALIETVEGFPLGEVVHSWKSFTAKECNRVLKRQGEFWMPDYFDRFIRDARHMRAVEEYVANNPVKAGLCAKPEEWRWSHMGTQTLGMQTPGTRASCPQNNNADETSAIPGGPDETSAIPGGPDGTSALPGGPDGTSAFPGGPDGTSAFPGFPSLWTGTCGLAADVRYYGRLIRQRAQKKIGHLYPKVKLPKEQGGGEANVIAWLWARTVVCPNPGCGAKMPLVRSFWLAKKKPVFIHAKPVLDAQRRTVRFAPISTGEPQKETTSGKGARCLFCGTFVGKPELRKIASEHGVGCVPFCVVADGPRGRLYLPAQTDAIPDMERPDVPEVDQPMTNDRRWFSPPLYGLPNFADLFTPRQLTALTFLSDAVREIRDEIIADFQALETDVQKTSKAWKTDAEAYATAVCTFLALAVDRLADFNCSLSSWKPSGQQQMHLFTRQAIPMVWDYAEANVLGEKAICWHTSVNLCADAIETIPAGAFSMGRASQMDAPTAANGSDGLLISTDPPYYDNIGYAALSDFFYVWLRRTIGDLYRPLCDTVLVPKMPELTASPERFEGDKEKAKEHFESGFRKTFTHLRERLDPRFPLTVYYAFKQDDEESGGSDVEAGNGSAVPAGRQVDLTTGWETLLGALISSGFTITATCPVRASQAWRMVSMGTNALASYIVLACRPRVEEKRIGRAAFIAELKRELPGALHHLQQGNVAPVDFAQAAIGPGMAVFSRYSAVLESDGRPMSVRTALALINAIKDELLGEAVEELDKDTRWAATWFAETGFDWGEAGKAILLATARGTAMNNLIASGIVAVQGNQVRLYRPDELPLDWDPATDKYLTVWEMTHHLIRVYVHEKKGDNATAEMLRKLGAKAEVARDLAYKLFTVCESKKRSQEAQAYNELVMGWPELARLAREAASRPKMPTQGELLL